MQTSGSKYSPAILKHLFICAALAVLSTVCVAQVKVVEKSAKKAPGWVNGVEKNFLIVSASAGDVEAAKEKILNSIREQIVHAVAVNVQSEAAISVQETVLNGKVRRFLETTGTTIQTRAGRVPFLNEIALSNAVDYYWEKQQDRKTKAVTVLYHIKYPFPEIQLQELVYDFKEADGKLTAQLTELCESVDTIRDMDGIGKNIAALQQLQKLFDDGRSEQAGACIANYRSLYALATLEETAHQAGSLTSQLLLGGKPATTIQTPRVKSNCADIVKVKIHAGGSAEVSYQTAGCYADLENYIELSYHFGGKNITQKFFFTLNNK
jgi:hypothetical protein